MDDSASMDRYMGRCQAVLIRLAEYVPDEFLEQAQHLIDHGEPAEGLCSLAWCISKRHARVPASDIREIRELTAGMVLQDHMPPDLEDCAIPG